MICQKSPTSVLRSDLMGGPASRVSIVQHEMEIFDAQRKPALQIDLHFSSLIEILRNVLARCRDPGCKETKSYVLCG